MRSRSFLVISRFSALVLWGCSGNNSHPEARERADGAAGNHDSAAGDSDAQTPCIPQPGPDLPDESFTDSNCDGIDGDATDAIFVEPDGLDGEPGTREAPVRTIQHAVELATASGKSSVYLCNAEYAETVRLVGDSVSLYGGYDCAHDWKRTTDRAIVHPATGVPLTVENVAESITVSHLSVRAPDTMEFGASSIALVALNSKGVVVSHSEIVSGRAGPGSPAVPPALGSQPQQAPAANAPSVTTGSNCVSQSSTTCLLSSGGAACSSSAPGATGTPRACPGLDGLNVNGGNGGSGGNCSLAEPFGGSGSLGVPPIPVGTVNLNGAAGLPGAAATIGFGSVAGGRYFPTNVGADGMPGNPGYAGRGGTGGQSYLSGTLYVIGGGGGQGGYPGCPGLAGHGGGGGGASIALLARGTRVSSVGALFGTGDGGMGGPASAGSSGQPGGVGGLGGSGTGVQPGQQGQKGGDGGAGGFGGAGGGGPSIGIVYDGAAPVLTSTTFVVGKGGVGAAAASGKAADGLAAETYQVPAVDGGL